MSRTVITAKNLSKCYFLSNESQGGYSTLVETLSNSAKNLASYLAQPLDKFKKRTPKYFEEFWALRDVNLEIQEGDRVGIIGRNGAGKSTLLKILSRIITPSSGEVRIRGRVASLLEVGTGFHQELTGRENIFLNGAILGMKHQEILSKFDEIVAFADIGKFLDMPVKRYSSGMITRLGFAVAAHLDPDVLIVDEVLAVGDAMFQQKCVQKINELGSGGRTIIFVSHDVGSVMSICNKGLYLERGTVKEQGPVEACVNAYMRTQKIQALSWQGNAGDEHIRFYSACLTSENKVKEFFYQGETTKLELEYEVIQPSHDLVLGVGVWNQRNQLIARAHTSDDVSGGVHFLKPGRHKVAFNLDSGLFHEGQYLVKLDCHLHNQKKIITDEIILKYPVFVPQKHTRFGHLAERDGVFLGNKWEAYSS